ncbi:MAG: hypothetical protein ABIH99_05415 [Candidatus Micrarchaeota archaeon]
MTKNAELPLLEGSKDEKFLFETLMEEGKYFGVGSEGWARTFAKFLEKREVAEGVVSRAAREIRRGETFKYSLWRAIEMEIRGFVSMTDRMIEAESARKQEKVESGKDEEIKFIPLN